jgi:hypothetical protein
MPTHLIQRDGIPQMEPRWNLSLCFHGEFKHLPDRRHGLSECKRPPTKRDGAHLPVLLAELNDEFRRLARKFP